MKHLTKARSPLAIAMSIPMRMVAREIMRDIYA
jgi:hypothetical protein